MLGGNQSETSNTAGVHRVTASGGSSAAESARPPKLLHCGPVVVRRRRTAQVPFATSTLTIDTERLFLYSLVHKRSRRGCGTVCWTPIDWRAPNTRSDRPPPPQPVTPTVPGGSRSNGGGRHIDEHRRDRLGSPRRCRRNGRICIFPSPCSQTDPGNGTHGRTGRSTARPAI